MAASLAETLFRYLPRQHGMNLGEYVGTEERAKAANAGMSSSRDRESFGVPAAKRTSNPRAARSIGISKPWRALPVNESQRNQFEVPATLYQPVFGGAG